MPGGTPVPYATFVAEFPEFSEIDPVVVTAQLVRAATWVDPKVWGVQANDGMKYLAAHFLALSPFGMNTKLVAKGATTSTYFLQFQEMQLAIRGGPVVAGGGRFRGRVR